jgi:hypothetical protein
MSKWEWGSVRNWFLKPTPEHVDIDPQRYFNRPPELIRYNFTDGAVTYYQNGVLLQDWEAEDAIMQGAHITDYYIDNTHMATPAEPEEEEQEEQPEPQQTPEQVWAEITEMVEDNYGSGMSSLFNAMKGLIDELYVKNKDLETQIANLSERLDTINYYNEAV